MADALFTVGLEICGEAIEPGSILRTRKYLEGQSSMADALFTVGLEICGEAIEPGSYLL